MKKYEYVNMVYEGIVNSKLSEHRQIINERAEKGWRYVGYIPTHESSYGVTCAIDLIFEKDVEETE